MTDTERTCGLCDEPAIWIAIQVQKEGTDETKSVDLCKGHYDKLERYNRGEEVDWDV